MVNRDLFTVEDGEEVLNISRHHVCKNIREPHAIRKHREILRRFSVMTLAGILCFANAVPVIAAPVSNGVYSTYDETYYGITDYYGNLVEGSIVKSFMPNGISKITDYGYYDEVINLTDTTEPIIKNGMTTFEFAEEDVPKHFYFEGKTKTPFENLPWHIEMSYMLNGVPTKAENLAGEKGVVDINLDFIPNETASTYSKNNYTLEAMAVFNQDDILSLEAPGAQVQLVGNLRTVIFVVLPGEEQHFTIRVGAESFTFGGMNYLMMPATLKQLEQISVLGDRKNELEQDYEILMDSLDVFLDSMDDISDSLDQSANGLDELNVARGTISAGKDKLYTEADAIRADLKDVEDALEPVAEQIEAASQAVTDTKTVLNATIKETNALRSDLKDLKKLIEKAQKRSGSQKGIIFELQDTTSDLKTHMNSLKGALDYAKNEKIDNIAPLFAGMTSAELKVALTKANASIPSLNTAYTALGGGSLNFEKFVTFCLMQSGGDTSLASGLANARESFPTKEAADAVDPAYGVAWENAEPMYQAFVAAGGNDGGLDFVGLIQAASLVSGQSMTREEAESAYQLYELYQADSGIVDVLLLEADTLNEKLTLINDSIDKVNGLINGLASPTSKVVGDLTSLCGDIDNLLDQVDDAGDIGTDIITSCTKILDEIENLNDVLNKYEPKLRESLNTAKKLSVTASKTVHDTGEFFDSFQSLLKKSGVQLDKGTKDSLEGVSVALRATAKSLKKTKDIKNATKSIDDIVRKTWDEHTGVMDNFLNMDANADAISLTSENNPAPTSIQVLIRTQEIKIVNDANDDVIAKDAKQMGFFARIAQMFKDFGAAIVGLFK